jgi:hypothetical protein
MKQTIAKTFKAVTPASLPKGIIVLSTSMPDGAYRLAAEFVIPYNRYGTDIVRAAKEKRTLPAGTVIISTEGGHYYRFNDNGNGLSGLSKRNDTLSGALAQRISITEITVDAYKATRKPAKKKVAKKKKATRRSRS